MRGLLDPGRKINLSDSIVISCACVYIHRVEWGAGDLAERCTVSTLNATQEGGLPTHAWLLLAQQIL